MFVSFGGETVHGGRHLQDAKTSAKAIAFLFQTYPLYSEQEPQHRERAVKAKTDHRHPYPGDPKSSLREEIKEKEGRGGKEGFFSSGWSAYAWPVWFWVLGPGLQVLPLVGLEFPHGLQSQAASLNLAACAEFWESADGGQASVWDLV